MNRGFKVSVVIPVYNAAGFIRQAVESAVILDEVAEVLLVEDASPDNALEICMELEEEYQKVRLLQHPNCENRGAGESRNLGILNARYDYIAFLDADDFYLKNRFLKTAEVFKKYSDCDGVYEAVGINFHDEVGKANFTKRISLSNIDQEYLTTIRKEVKPEKLFEFLLTNNSERFSTIGLCIRKEVFKKSGYFNPKLRLHQDSELWLRIAYNCRLYPGEVSEAVSIRRVHKDNRSNIKNSFDLYKFYKAIHDNFSHRDNLERSLKYLIVRKYLLAKYKLSGWEKVNFKIYLVMQLAKNPSLLFKLIK